MLIFKSNQFIKILLPWVSRKFLLNSNPIEFNYLYDIPQVFLNHSDDVGSLQSEIICQILYLNSYITMPVFLFEH